MLKSQHTKQEPENYNTSNQSSIIANASSSNVLPPNTNKSITQNYNSTTQVGSTGSKKFFNDESEEVSTNMNKNAAYNNSNLNNVNNKQSTTNNNFINVSTPITSKSSNNSTTNIPTQLANEYNSEKSEKTNKDSGNISIKFDPAGDIKDAKLKVDMDAETAWNFFQNNKKYLPTTQQVISGAKATANFVEKTGNKLNEYDSNSTQPSQNEKEKETLVTGNKNPQSKKATDPLTMANLFGLKSNNSQNAANKSTAGEKPAKKGFF